METKAVEPQEVVKSVRAMFVGERKARKEAEGAGERDIVEVEETGELASWREKLVTRLLTIPPASFERLCMRVLRESGFIQVEVTGRSGDGWIDGYGVVRLVGMLSFRVSFQCKRYRDNVSASVVRDFRGAMMGREEKGLIITTGGFTRDARQEATRNGATAIDLIDGELLADKLKELGLHHSPGRPTRPDIAFQIARRDRLILGEEERSPSPLYPIASSPREIAARDPRRALARTPGRTAPRAAHP